MRVTEEFIDTKTLAKVLESYGFLVIESTKESKILNILRDNGIIHLFQVHRIKGYTIIELNRASCERECNSQCRYLNGIKDYECFSACLDNCIMDRISIINSQLLR